MVYAVVHKDEKTPHMHVGMVPITSEGKLAAKQFFGKKTELQQLQDKFHEHVTKKGNCCPVRIYKVYAYHILYLNIFP
ncbi:plasmid recombination protein [Peribacillus muralis]|uniref:plasmid recombination protein n=1 Tax=Peribacillus muralis TaxID=264697 RepID=UPI00382E552A